MFRCDWVDGRKGLKVDHYKFTCVNFNYLIYKDNKLTDEPFIFASQAEQVMYIQDPRHLDWHVAIRMTSRDTFDMGAEDGSASFMEILQSQPYAPQFDGGEAQQEDESTSVRNDMEGIPVITQGSSKREKSGRTELGEGGLDDIAEENENDEDEFEEESCGDSDDDDMEEVESDDYVDDDSNDEMELDN